jgi:hypothetical protein
MTQPGRGQAEACTDADDAAVIQLSRHEPEHFTLLFRKHAPYIQRYVVRRIGQDEADGIVAVTFPHAFRQPGGRIAVIGPNFKYCAREYFDCADHTVILTHVAMAEHPHAAGFDVTAVSPQFGSGVFPSGC